MGNEHFKSQQLRSKSPLPFSWLLAVITLCTSVFSDSTINLDTDFSTLKCVLYFNKPAATMLMASSGFALSVAPPSGLVIKCNSIF